RVNVFFFQAEDGIRDYKVTGVQTCALPISERGARLTHQLLAFSRKQRLAPTPLDLNRLVSEASDMLFRTIGATVRIETVLTDGRSEERRVGKEGRCGWGACRERKNKCRRKR